MKLKMQGSGLRNEARSAVKKVNFNGTVLFSVKSQGCRDTGRAAVISPDTAISM